MIILLRHCECPCSKQQKKQIRFFLGMAFSVSLIFTIHLNTLAFFFSLFFPGTFCHLSKKIVNLRVLQRSFAIDSEPQSKFRHKRWITLDSDLSVCLHHPSFEQLGPPPLQLNWVFEIPLFHVNIKYTKSALSALNSICFPSQAILGCSNYPVRDTPAVTVIWVSP